MSSLDLNKSITTVQGAPVRIVCVDRKCGRYPIIALITKDDGTEEIESYTEDGKFRKDQDDQHGRDLINATQQRRAWVNAYPDQTEDCLHLSRESANMEADPSRLGCIPIEYKVPV